MDYRMLEFLRRVGIDENSSLDILEEKIADYLQVKGFDKDYKPTDDGLICESILDCIGGQSNES